MAEKAIPDVMGAGSSQTPTQFIISKPGLAAILAAAGFTFTPKDTNTLDELVTAVLCAGLAGMKPADREADPLNRNVEFRYDPAINFDTTVIDAKTYERHTIEAALYKHIPTPAINPSDFG
jgi:hypothetical protein